MYEDDRDIVQSPEESEDKRSEAELREELIGNKSLDTYRENYLVEAGAGAGKTYILTNRVITQLLSGAAKPEELAAITFTEKATQQMVDEIDKKLLEKREEAASTCGEDSPETERIQNLIDSIDQMQISTIHSFCRTMLTTMPFSSELGPEFDVVDDPGPLADAFFELQVRDHPEFFKKARDLTGIGYDALKESFRMVCESRGELVCAHLDDAQISRRMDDMRTLAGNLYILVSQDGSEDNIRSRTSKTVEVMMPGIREVLRLKDGPEEAFIQAVLEACNPCTLRRGIEAEAVARVLPGAIKDNKKIVEDSWKPIEEAWGGLIHALSMETFTALLPAYRRYKRLQKTATQQDLLNCARDMLRDSAEARQYFHRKYTCIYVDEMQDTDPVQAEILFYLTTEEAAFDPKDWRRCRPAKGSLFLVGDPKQAIYRFRGADITVYKTLETLFRGGVGRVVHLHNNYRSSSEITEFSREMFEDLLTGGEYQAVFSEMESMAGQTKQARIHAYDADRKSDPGQVAALIAQMVHDRILLGTENHLHEASYADFMILTNTNARTEEYVKALAAYGIPCSLSGAKKYSEIPQLIRGNAALQALADPGDETKLATALVTCYAIPYTMLRAYRQMTGTLTANPVAVKRALVSAGLTEKLRALLDALEELNELQKEAERLPALAVAENLWLKSRAVWQRDPENGKSNVQGKEYPMVLQFLHELRAFGTSLPALAEKAEELLAGAADRELLLTEESDCVRIMNLHKAKGLEAEVVILAFDSAFKADADRHVHYEGGREELHLCLTRANPFGGRTAFAKPAGWAEGPGREEEEFLRAQITRLLYVAATRAKTCLLVCAGKKSAWADIAARCPKRQETDEKWEKAFRALESGKTDFTLRMEAEDAALSIDPQKLEKQLRRRAERLSASGVCRLSPSMLEIREDSPAATGTDMESARPYGAKWGTIIHRLMELSVRNRAYEEEDRRRMALQAVYETLQGEELTAEDRQMLGITQENLSEAVFPETLADEAVRQTDFIRNPDHPLRSLLDSGKCYAELPFAMRIPQDDPMRELCGMIPEGQAEMTEMRGVIDLAVRGEDGWTLLDYKTDSLYAGETEEAYRQRLRLQYTPQLRIYREILNRLNLGQVCSMVLCAVRLRGELIDLG